MRETAGVVLRPPTIPDFVTPMAWETRERGGRYYYRARREGGRVVKEYVGTGEVADIVAHAEETLRRHRQREAARWRKELEPLTKLTPPMAELCEAAEILARASLIAAGFRRHKGEWRRARG
jgi:hypothetical protein